MTHTFVICAYQESAYLEECIRSVMEQTVRSEILLATSTPNRYIQDLCDKYHIPMRVNEGEKGITQDWNFAYSICQTDCVTITHQDDIYARRYAEELLECLEDKEKPIMYFTDYGEIRNGEHVLKNKNLTIKRIMLAPFRISALQKSQFVRRRILSFGCPICCPSVTLIKENCPETVFEHGFQSDEDWQAWEKLSRREGSFVYNPHVLMYHRIHAESETTRIIQDHGRTREDYLMLRKFWPSPIAKLLAKAYSSSQKTNTVEE